MTDEAPRLREAERAEITVLVDNYTDIFVPSQKSVDHRPPFALDRPLLAEHGLSCFIKVVANGKEHTILMDTSLSCGCMLHNACQLGMDPAQTEAIVLSHGHFDHTGGLSAVLHRVGHQMPLIVHPDAFLSRRLKSQGKIVDLPRLDPVSLKKDGAAILERPGPSLLASGHLLVTGAIERTVEFEKGFPGMEAHVGGKWIPDQILDDQGLVINIKGKGLVVISGCAHAGIINTIRYAQKVTGVDCVYAVLGGFHLTGPLFEPVIAPTVEAMKQINPEYLVPMHCTGWEAINRFFSAFPKAGILNTVGTTYIF
ncbi:MBL fold metallo-hydrolase [Methanoregula sp.]|uniref:MBL fold metallo-hydrolase n=1 Tax=Methanoregula sp. TaxID=2052170 RepID=UPI002B58108F|nr:MBL fold metallo-hydrolase [Methanoregula sp.]HVP97314.1 MBL fold metallo-hydrolase [Methanoregula sp.]